MMSVSEIPKTQKYAMVPFLWFNSIGVDVIVLEQTIYDEDLMDECGITDDGLCDPERWSE
jgi:hypothetical protein